MRLMLLALLACGHETLPLNAAFTPEAATFADGALQVTTRSIGRETGRTPALVAPSTAETGERRYARPDHTEWWLPLRGGWEQGWDVYTPPPGEGPLTVTVQFEGATLTGSSDARVELDVGGQRLHYQDPYAWDAEGAALAIGMAARADETGVVVTLTVEDADAHYPIFIDPILVAAGTTVSGTVGSDFGSALAGWSTGAAVGAPTGDGSVSVYTGSSLSWTVNGTAGAQLGAALAAGDVTGDGVVDLLVGAPGAASVQFFSNASNRVADGSLGGPDDFGAAIAVVGDTDNNGYNDVLVGAPGHSDALSNQGGAWLYTGGSGGPDTVEWSSVGATSNAKFGRAVAGGGDIDGDGLADFLVAGAGFVDVGFGDAAGPTVSTSLTSSSTSFGTAIASLGDFTGDGYDDVAVGDPSIRRVYVYSGSSSTMVLASVLTGGTGASRFGESLLAPGDLDDDGRADLVVGDPNTTTGDAISIYAGSASAPALLLGIDSTGGGLGAALALSGLTEPTLWAGAPDNDAVMLYPITLDDDGDGYGVDDDCDDSNAAVYPGATELCNGIDDDCDATTDEPDAAGAPMWYADADADGFGDPATSQPACAQPTGYVSSNTDCDPTSAAVYPGATEVCNSDDDDCDGLTDEPDAADAPTWYADADADGFGDLATSQLACAQPTGYVSDSTDCDDTNVAVYPNATELCNGLDDNCNTVTDEPEAADAPIWYADSDADGFGDITAPLNACNQPDGYLDDSTDCDDSSAEVFPGSTEYCNGADDDCDGETDEADAVDMHTWYADADGDTFGDPNALIDACDQPGGYLAYETADGWLPSPSGEGDCNDADAAWYPGAPETCSDPYDYNCDGSVLYADDDADGWAACLECDDSNASVNPDATEVCNGLDDDCNSSTDEGFSDLDSDTLADCVDADVDGDNVPGTSDCNDQDATIAPGLADACYDGIDTDCGGNDDYDCDQDGAPALAWGGADCDDTTATIGPHATDFPYDGIDRDCDGGAEFDQDGDGQDAAWYGGTDCDDSDASVFAGATEVWYDGVDQDCAGDSDYDGDDDGDDDATWGGGDCDDADPTIYAGAPEVSADGIDQDCDGADLVPCTDCDGDGFTSTSAGGTDCDDADVGTFPGAADAWYDGQDSDCGGDDDYDQDGDGYTAAAWGGGDCDDSNSVANPSQTVDDCGDGDVDCDGTVDEDCVIDTDPPQGDSGWDTAAPDPAETRDTAVGDWRPDPDASTDPEKITEVEGCGCASNPGAVSASGLVALLGLLLRRRRVRT